MKTIDKLNENVLMEESRYNIDCELIRKMNEVIEAINVVSMKVDIILTLDSISPELAFLCMSRRSRNLKRKSSTTF